MEEVLLLIGGQIFKTKKELLCEYSDYFRAMFSGNYVENEQKEIAVDVVDASSMNIILQYMDMGLIDLSEYSLSTISDLAKAADFLQIKELIKQIEYTLDLQLSVTNWMETMSIAENSSYSKLEQSSGAFGLLSFKEMKPDYIPSIQKLYWYLSHPYLNVDDEIDVFKFGLQWISFNMDSNADALIIILACLDVERVTLTNLEEMKKLMSDYENSLAAKVVDLLYYLSSKEIGISVPKISEKKMELFELFSETVYNEVLNLVNESKRRLLRYTPLVPVWVCGTNCFKPNLVPHCMYSYDGNTLCKWLEVAEKDLWGWSVTSWGPTKLIVVCGEHGKGTGIFMRDVKVYDTIRKEWTCHGVKLPPRRHSGITVVGDSLYMIGGVGEFRILLDSGIIYDLNQRSFRSIANLPDALQCPAVCSLNNAVYVACQKSIYKYEDNEDRDSWKKVIGMDFRVSCMTSFKNYIYCMQNFFVQVYRFRPELDDKIELVTCLSNPPASICNLGDRLFIYTSGVCEVDAESIEEYYGGLGETPKVLWSRSHEILKFNNVSGSCALVLSAPPVETNFTRNMSQYHKKHLIKFANLY